MSRIFAVVLGLILTTGAQAQDANCRAQWSQVSSLLQQTGRIDTPLPGLIRETADGGCRTNGLVFPASEHVTIKVDSVRWRGTDLARFTAQGLPPTSLDLWLEGVAVVPVIGDPVFNYLQGIQAQNSTIDARVSIEWDNEARALQLERFRIDLPQDDFIEVSALIEGVDLSTKRSIQMSAGSFAITSQTLVVRSTHMFQSYLLIPLGTALLDGAENPAKRTEDLKQMARGAIDLAPSDVLSPATKSALKAMVADMPDPSGVLTVQQKANPGLGPARFLRLAAQGLTSIDDFWKLLDGVEISVSYDKL